MATGGRTRPPRNPLEEFLVPPVAEGTDISEVGIFDDFSVLGGDSAFQPAGIHGRRDHIQIDVPDGVFEHFSPIALLAEKLVEFGVDPHAPVGAGMPGAGMSDAELTVRLIRGT